MLKFKKIYLYLLSAPLTLALVACSNKSEDISSVITVDTSQPNFGLFKFATTPPGPPILAPGVGGSVPTPISYTTSSVGNCSYLSVTSAGGPLQNAESTGITYVTDQGGGPLLFFTVVASDNTCTSSTVTINYTVGTKKFTGSATFV